MAPSHGLLLSAHSYSSLSCIFMLHSMIFLVNMITSPSSSLSSPPLCSAATVGACSLACCSQNAVVEAGNCLVQSQVATVAGYRMISGRSRTEAVGQSHQHSCGLSHSLQRVLINARRTPKRRYGLAWDHFENGVVKLLEIRTHLGMNL